MGPFRTQYTPTKLQFDRLDLSETPTHVTGRGTNFIPTACNHIVIGDVLFKGKLFELCVRPSTICGCFFFRREKNEATVKAGQSTGSTSKFFPEVSKIYQSSNSGTWTILARPEYVYKLCLLGSAQSPYFEALNNNLKFLAKTPHEVI